MCLERNQINRKIKRFPRKSKIKFPPPSSSFNISMFLLNVMNDPFFSRQRSACPPVRPYAMPRATPAGAPFPSARWAGGWPAPRCPVRTALRLRAASPRSRRPMCRFLSMPTPVCRCFACPTTVALDSKSRCFPRPCSPRSKV